MRSLVRTALLIVTIVVGTFFTPIVLTTTRAGVAVRSDLLRLVAGPGAVVLGIAVLAAFARGGGRGLRAAAVFLVGRGGAGEAAPALRTAARSAAFAGLLVGAAGIAAFLEVYASGFRHEAPYVDVFTLRSWTTFAPILGLLLGRLILGTAAEEAARLADRPGRAFTRLDDLLLAGSVVFPALWVTAPFVTYPVTKGG